MNADRAPQLKASVSLLSVVMAQTLMLKMTFLLIVLGVCISSNPICAQSGQSAKPEIYGAPDGLTGNDCEGIKMRLDFVAIAAQEAGSDQTVIIISRLGSGERSRSLSRGRLKLVADYLNRMLARERIISAEGGGVKGLGQLEFYVAGKLNIVFKARRNSDLVRGCGADG